LAETKKRFRQIEREKNKTKLLRDDLDLLIQKGVQVLFMYVFVPPTGSHLISIVPFLSLPPSLPLSPTKQRRGRFTLVSLSLEAFSFLFYFFSSFQICFTSSYRVLFFLPLYLPLHEREGIFILFS